MKGQQDCKFGIDFGTTNSVIAFGRRSGVLEGEQLEPILDENGAPFPSVVLYRHDGQILVGADAKRVYFSQRASEQGRIFKSIKQMLGQDKEYDVDGQRLTPEDIAGEIFQFLKSEAENQRRVSVETAVVGIPIYFDAQKRKALRAAASKAGLTINGFIHEPTAAICHYGIDIRHTSNVVVFDWGGGTLDISVVKVKDREIRELAIDGLDIAGDHFDEKLVDYVINRFVERHRMKSFDLDSGDKDKVFEACEKAKQRLSNDEQASISIPFFGGVERHLEDEITRDTFNQLIASTVEEAFQILHQTIQRSNLSDEEIHKVLLVGGTCQIPLIFHRMEARFGSRVVVPPNPATSIAQGAARAALHEIHPFLADYIGVRLCDGTFFRIFKRGTPIPTEGLKEIVEFYVSDNSQGKARIVVCESSHDEANNPNLQTKGILTIPISRVKEERVFITFEIDADLMLTVSGHGFMTCQKETIAIPDIKYGLRWERR